MEWVGGEASMFPEEENSTAAQYQQPSAESMASLCQSQQQCVKASIVSSWQLAEAQDRLCGLELHGSESAEQEHARAQAGSAELFQREREWRHKESLLGGGDLSRSPMFGPECSRDVFNKSIINVQSGTAEVENDRSKPFVQKYDQQLRHFGMLRRWDDSQRFLSAHPHVICEEAANFLILWCFRLQAEEKEALMEQVAHQAVVMQFILEMARTSQQDPRGCFRQFFQKAKAGQEGYLDVFLTELEAFKQRVKEYTLKSQVEAQKDTEPRRAPNCCPLDPKEVLDSLPPTCLQEEWDKITPEKLHRLVSSVSKPLKCCEKEWQRYKVDLKAGLQLQDMQILQNVLSNMNPQVAEYHVKRCLEAGLWNHATRGLKEDSSEVEEPRTMEMS